MLTCSIISDQNECLLVIVYLEFRFSLLFPHQTPNIYYIYTQFKVGNNLMVGVARVPFSCFKQHTKNTRPGNVCIYNRLICCFRCCIASVYIYMRTQCVCTSETIISTFMAIGYYLFVPEEKKYDHYHHSNMCLSTPTRVFFFSRICVCFSLRVYYNIRHRGVGKRVQQGIYEIRYTNSSHSRRRPFQYLFIVYIYILFFRRRSQILSVRLL